MKFLSPKSKSARYANSRLQRHRLEKHVKKLYKRTKVELPQDQSAELCKLVKASKIQMLEGKNLPKFTMKATSSQAAKGRNQVIASKKCGKKTGNVSSEISGVMVRTYVNDIYVPFS